MDKIYKIWEVTLMRNAFVANERKDSSKLCKIADAIPERYIKSAGERDDDFEIN